MSQNIYEVRDQQGSLKFKLSEKLAKALILKCKGNFRDGYFPSGEETRIYFFAESYLFGNIAKDGFELMISKGDKLHPAAPEPSVDRPSASPGLG